MQYHQPWETPGLGTAGWETAMKLSLTAFLKTPEMRRWGVTVLWAQYYDLSHKH